MAREFAEVVLKYRWLFLIGSLVMAGVAGSGARFITISTEPRDNFGPDNPQLVAFEDLEETFSRVENIFVAISPDDGQVFTPRVLRIIETLTEEAWKTPFVQRVDSLTNYQHTEADGDDLLVDNLVEFFTDAPDELSSQELARIRDIVLNDIVLNDIVLNDVETV
jgi:hypothetical protein